MKKFRITWIYEQTGTSEIMAEDLDDAKGRAEESITDFGDPKEFTQDDTWNTGWEVKTIEEVI